MPQDNKKRREIFYIWSLEEIENIDVKQEIEKYMIHLYITKLTKLIIL